MDDAVITELLGLLALAPFSYTHQGFASGGQIEANVQMLRGYSDNSEAVAKKRWAAFQSAIKRNAGGTLDYRYQLGDRGHLAQMHVRAVWKGKRMVLEILSPSRSRAGFEISGRTFIDWSPHRSEKTTVQNLQTGSADPAFTPPFTLASVLLALHDPLCPWIDLAGSPSRVDDGKDMWVFSFPVPKGYAGPGYRYWVSKNSMLPTALSRAGEGMPDLHVSYMVRALKGVVVNLPAHGGAVDATAPTLGTAFERSLFIRTYENAMFGKS